jgi:hypothetical protein
VDENEMAIFAPEDQIDDKLIHGSALTGPVRVDPMTHVAPDSGRCHNLGGGVPD